MTKNKPFGIPRHRWGDSIKIRIKGTVWCARIWTEFISGRDWDLRWARLISLMNLRVLQSAGNILNSYVIISFSRISAHEIGIVV
jgi:hypothetical protein